MAPSRPALCVVAVFAVLTVPGAARGGPIFFGASPYAGFADSPFHGAAYTYFHLETFEDGHLNVPGVAASAGIVIGNDRYVDSVDQDDGVADGSGGSSSHSWYSNRASESILFSFDAAALGTLPTDVGLVFTDIGWNAPTSYYGPVLFEAFGPGGILLGQILHQFGDGQDQGQAAEDRFFGVSYMGGISSIRIGTNNSDWEVDHLQYGAAPVASAPEPSTLVLTGLGGLAMLRRRLARRRS